MVLQANTKKQPILSASPLYLQFGDFDIEKLQGELPSAILTITNTGEDVLSGRINPQVPWIRVEPPDFCCAAGEFSNHQVILEKDTPHTWRDRTYSYDYLMLINSNGGSFFIGGSYTARGEHAILKKPKSSKRPFIFPILASVLLMFMLGILAFLVSQGRKQAVAYDILFTQGAGTVIAELTQTAASQSTLQNPQTINLFEPAATRTAPTTEGTAAVTLTPWPRDQFPNHEQFIRDYYDKINQKNYAEAWTMLSKNFQQSCCYIALNDPYQVYLNWWNTIEKVEVTSAYLQAWDTNPAEVYTSLKYTTNKGEIVEVVNDYFLIADAETKSLLIDQVK